MRVLCLIVFTLPTLIFGMPGDCTAFFSHHEKLDDRLIEMIDQQKQSIQMAAYCLTSAKVAKALIRAKTRGVDLAILVDPFSIKKRSSIHRLNEAQIPLYVWDRSIQMSTKKGKARMHENFCVFGDQLVWVGPFNSAKRNQENAIVIKSKELAKTFSQEFSYLKLYESRTFSDYLALSHKKERAKKSSTQYASRHTIKEKK